MATVMCLITFITISGNAAVVIALKKAAPRFPTHYPLASLAFADLMVGLLVLPLATARELFIFQPSWTVCAFWSTLDVLGCTASILSLCTLGWERWCGISDPLARAKRAKRARLFAMLVWPISAAVALPTAFIPSPKHSLSGETIKACTINTNIGYVFYSNSFSFYLPASGMTFLYTKILMALAVPPPLRTHRGRGNPADGAHAQGTAVQPSQSVTPVNSEQSSCAVEVATTPLAQRGAKLHVDVSRTPKRCHLDLPANGGPSLPSPLQSSKSQTGIFPRQRRATQTIVMLMSLFLVCWTPFFIMLPVDSLCSCVSERIWLVCTWLGYVNSSLNPLVYAAASPTVRRALTASLTLSTSSRNDVPLTPTARRRIAL